jgi:hypothetical protein
LACSLPPSVSSLPIISTIVAISSRYDRRFDLSHAAAASCMEPTEVNANALRWSLLVDGARRNRAAKSEATEV